MRRLQRTCRVVSKITGLQAAHCQVIKLLKLRGHTRVSRVDEAVRKAMERWPNVPDVYGWLRLDRRGQWLIKDETIANVTVRDFISRNYLRTDGGAYAFQMALSGFS